MLDKEQFKRFPTDFKFELSHDEWNDLRCNFSTSSWGGQRYLPLRLPSRDLAKLYEVETKALKQAVRRNINRFPEDFMFQLTKEEWITLRSQSVTLEGGKGSHPVDNNKKAKAQNSLHFLATFAHL